MAERENLQADSLLISEPDTGLELTTYEIVTEAKTKSWLLNELSQQAPRILCLKRRKRTSQGLL